MTTRTHFWFHQSGMLLAEGCKRVWQQLSTYFQSLRQLFSSLEPVTDPWSPIDERVLTAAQAEKPNMKKWMLAETEDAQNNKNVMMVEVEYFSYGEPSPPANEIDLSAKITHYPSSNYLH